MPLWKDVLREEIEKVIEMLSDATELTPGRELALVKTKLQEAKLWASQL